ncbi:MAG: LysM peptidoglycan-binding domain-containing protein [Chloroflexota bacterium]
MSNLNTRWLSYSPRKLFVFAVLLTAVFITSCSPSTNASPTPLARLPFPTQPVVLPDPTDPNPTQEPEPTTVISETAVLPTTAIPTALPPTNEPATNPDDCTPNEEWPTYVVQIGDNLNKIAAWSDTTIEALMLNNCLSSSNLIFAGQVLHVPQTASPTPTATDQPTQSSSISFASFSLSHSTVERNSTLMLYWETINASVVTVWPLAFDSKTNSWLRIPVDQTYQGVPVMNLTAESGEALINILPQAQYPYRFELTASNEAGETAVVTTALIDINCYPSIALLSSSCPGPSETTTAYIQTFENGTLLWLDNTQEILLLSTHDEIFVPWTLLPPAILVEALPEPPAGLTAPAPRFAGLWDKPLFDNPDGDSPEKLSLGEIIGWAIQPEQAYEAALQIHWDNNFNGVSDTALVVSLPNSQFVSLTVLEPFAKTGPSWRYIVP